MASALFYLKYSIVARESKHLLSDAPSLYLYLSVAFIYPITSFRLWYGVLLTFSSLSSFFHSPLIHSSHLFLQIIHNPPMHQIPIHNSPFSHNTKTTNPEFT
ncbi:hypothetical protein EYC80_001814 [Monilinia laxa]|uniref:Uncharacterized protein n=1 Tax=Monilinia laxa TaxID=61186 RepID=A0A5N6K6A7_MONLA|nr:hypothetical protein EYC80_001814 [Monilinia laxa]